MLLVSMAKGNKCSRSFPSDDKLQFQTLEQRSTEERVYAPGATMLN